MSNLRKAITAMSSAGSLALILSGAAMAAPPVGFNTLGQWNVDSAGVVTATCPTGFTCATLADGSGFKQIEMTSNAVGGPRYIRTLIGEGFTAAGADITRLSFASEDFVQLGGTQGVASAITVREGAASPTGTAAGSITSGFSTSAQILGGWATNNAANRAETTLGLTLSDQGADPDGAGVLTAASAGGDEFLTGFSVTANTLAATGANVTDVLSVGQTVYVGGLAAVNDRQRFVTLIEPAVTAQTAFKFAASTDPATLAWAIGDKIQVVWAGQDISGAGAFSTQSLIKADGTSVRASNLALPGTFEWTATPATVLNSEFGAAPAF